MAAHALRPHQREAVDAVLRALELTIRSTVPERGLRTQVVMATGSGKTPGGRVAGRGRWSGCLRSAVTRPPSRAPRTWASWSPGCAP
ncbi:DEAD/DEAH box helicase family protein [Streptomyces sp. NPDC058145]|uniref:DEAD/DEAH box helicase family protein n=1 Tax=Streptomyces sp. NPDC058145 TaxID=3346356 RepID=UPI0036EC61DC